MQKPGQLAITYRAADSLRAYENNARTHSAEQIEQIAASIDAFGMAGTVVVREGVIAKGHGTLAAVRALYADGKQVYPPPGREQGAEPYPTGTVPVLDASGWTDAQFRAFVIADNKLAESAGWDMALLAAEISDLQAEDFDLAVLGFDDAELRDLLDESEGPSPSSSRGTPGALADRFVVPPFSTLDARTGEWQARKRAWLALGIRSDVGRDAPVFGDLRNMKDEPQHATSIFDPVLCELAYRWFCPPGGLVVDPFAGGSVRGITAARLGRRYVGVDVRDEQVAANRDQVDILEQDDPLPVWHVGDSRNIVCTLAGVEADFVFSCPPYADLECYSDRPDDLSTMKYSAFLAAYREIIAGAVSLLKPDRFACFVVGDIRDRKGAYRNFVADTIAAFIDAGMVLYNDAVLLTALGSAPVRTGAQFTGSRKLGKVHQNVLVFLKGDAKRAAAACGDVDVSDDFLVESDA